MAIVGAGDVDIPIIRNDVASRAAAGATTAPNWPPRSRVDAAIAALPPFIPSTMSLYMFRGGEEKCG